MKVKYSLVTLLSFWLMMSNSLAQDEKAEQIIRNYLEAIGGKKLWKKTQTRYDSVFSSVSVNENLEKSSERLTEKIKATYKKKPKMHKSIFYNEKGVQTFFCDGQELYMQTEHGHLTKIEDKKAIELVNFSEIDDFIDFQKAAYVTEEYLDDTICQVVDVYSRNDTSSFIRSYFSKETFFLLKTQTYKNNKPIELYSKFRNYQKLGNGLVIPFLEENYNQKNDLLFRTQRIKVVFDLPLEDNFFQPQK